MKKSLLIAWLATAGLVGANKLNAQSLTIGGGQFVSVYTNTNDFGPMRSPAATAAAGRYAYIYPQSLLNAIPNGAQIASLEFRRNGTATLADTARMKIYLRNTTDSTYGPGAINWVSRAANATLVYDADPKTATGNSIGFKRFNFTTPFTYTGGYIEMLIEYTQTAGPADDIDWHYDNATGVPQYIDNSTKVRQVTGSTTFPNDSTNLSNLRKPQVIFNFPEQNNVSVDRIFGTQYMLLNDTVVPSFYIKNTGINTQTFTVTLEGLTGYTSTKNITGLGRDSLLLVEFDPYLPTTVGNYSFKAYTNLATDSYTEDDTIVLPVVVADPLANSGVFDNGPIVTDPDSAFNGYDLSKLSPPLTTLGLNGSIFTAEKFWLPENANYNIDSVGFWAYQTGSGFVSNFTEVKVMIYDGDPSAGGQMIFGDSIANALSNTYFTGIMRASANSPLDSTRPIMRVLGEFLSPAVLQGGQSYWLVWNFTAGGTPFYPPITVPGVISSGNAIQRSNTTFEWSLGNGGGIGFPAGAPFQVYFRRDATSVNNLDPLAAKIGQLYPNPTSQAFSVAVDLQRNENVQLQLVDMQGRAIASKNLGMMAAGNHLLDMPVADLSPGMYFVKIRSGNFEVNRKLQVH